MKRNSNNSINEEISKIKNRVYLILCVGTTLLIFTALLWIYSNNLLANYNADGSREYEIVNGDSLSDLSLNNEPVGAPEIPSERPAKEAIDLFTWKYLQWIVWILLSALAILIARDLWVMRSTGKRYNDEIKPLTMIGMKNAFPEIKSEEIIKKNKK